MAPPPKYVITRKLIKRFFDKYLPKEPLQSASESNKLFECWEKFGIENAKCKEFEKLYDQIYEQTSQYRSRILALRLKEEVMSTLTKPTYRNLVKGRHREMPSFRTQKRSLFEEKQDHRKPRAKHKQRKFARGEYSREMSLKYLTTYFRTTKCYFYFQLAQLLSSLGVLLYVLWDPATNLKDREILWVELVFCLMILIDITVRLLAERQKFFDSLWNISDIVVFFVIMLLLCLFYILELDKVIDTKTLDEEDFLGLIILISRYLLQMIRVVILLKESHKMRKMNSQKFNLDIEMANKEADPKVNSIQFDHDDVHEGHSDQKANCKEDSVFES